MRTNGMNLHKLPLIRPKKQEHRKYVKLSNKNINSSDFLERPAVRICRPAPPTERVPHQI